MRDKVKEFWLAVITLVFLTGGGISANEFEIIGDEELAMLYTGLGKSPLVAVGPEIKMTLRDLDNSLDPGLSQMFQRLYEERLKVLRATLIDYVLGKESTSLGITKEALLKQEVETKIAPVTDEEIDAIISRNKATIPTGEAMQEKERIRFFLTNKRRSLVQGQYIAGLVKKYKVRVGLPTPVVRRYELDAMVRLSKGNPDAPVHIVEFGDAECGYCKKAQPVLTRLEKEYGDNIKFSFKHFPLGKDTFYTALGAECAYDQGKFWAFKDTMFTKAKPGNKMVIRSMAEEIGLDMTVFEECFAGEKHRAIVEKSKKDGEQVGVGGTPTIYVNGLKMRGANYSVLKRAIDKEIQEKTLALKRQSATGG